MQTYQGYIENGRIIPIDMPAEPNGRRVVITVPESLSTAEATAGCLLVESGAHLHYSLEELLSQCAESKDFFSDDREWLESPSAGRELL
ncbi:MAG: hypothetical protein LBI74_04615 [Synergistaceae bacterium]|jgi:hypothetical protein|nr:hypothetical protein [Synergistaceae bacterium]